MFSRHVDNQKKTVDELFNYFKLIIPKKDQCWVSYSVLHQHKIDLKLVFSALNRLDVPYDDTDPTTFKVLISQDAFGKILDDAYPSSVGKESADEPDNQLPGVKSKKLMVSSPQSVKNQSIPMEIEPSPADLPDPTTVQCQQILGRCLSQANHSTKPLFSGDEQHTLLEDYVKVALSTFEAKRDNETKPQFDSRIREYRVQQNTLKNQFKAQFSNLVSCDEQGEPDIFYQIQKELKQADKLNKIQRIQTLFPNTVEHLNVIQDTKFQQIYNKANFVMQQIDATRAVLDTLCKRAGLSSNVVDVQICPPRQSTKTGPGLKNNLLSSPASSLADDPLQSLEITLTAPNEAMAYSIYNMLVIAKIYPNEPFAGNPNKRYDAPMTFKLTYEEFDVLQRDLADLTKWYRDFENILSALFASDAADYVKTGCKPLHEAVRTEVEREKKNESPMISKDVRARFNQHPTDLFLLFGQCAIDLTNHPHKEYMRQLIQTIYTRCGLVDSKKDPKTFVKDAQDNLTFVSLMNVVHIRAIYDEVMALSTLSQLAKETGFPSIFTYLELMGVADEKIFYHTYLSQNLLDICMDNTFDKPSENQVDKRTHLNNEIGRLFPAPRAAEPETFSDIQKRYHLAIQNYLNNSMNVRCHQAPPPRKDLVPTIQEKNALLTANQNQQAMPFEITTAAQLDYTFEKVKASPNYRILSEAYNAYFQSVGARPIVTNNTTFDRQYIYMIPTLDGCLDKLRTELKRRDTSMELTYAKQAWLNTVMKIVYAEKMQIPQAALERAAEEFGGIFKIEEARDDLGSGCNSGLSGRCLQLESQLISGTDNAFKQFNRQLLIDNVEQSFNDTIASIQAGESSMAARIKPALMEYVGLESNTLRRDYAVADLTSFMKDLATRYNPGKIYDACYTYLCDEFKRCDREQDHNGTKTILTSLGYSTEGGDNELLQIDGKWNFKRFESFLPRRLVQLLRESDIIHLDQSLAGNLVIEATNQKYSFSQCIEEKQRRAETRRNQQRSQAAIPPVGNQQRSQAAIPPVGNQQRSQAVIPPVGNQQRSQAVIPPVGNQQSSQAAIPPVGNQQRRQEPSSLTAHTVFNVSKTPNNQSSTASSNPAPTGGGWGLGGLFGSTPATANQQQPSKNNVDLRGESKRAASNDPGSTT